MTVDLEAIRNRRVVEFSDVDDLCDEIERLREALEPFALADIPSDAEDDSWAVNHLGENSPLVMHFRRARAALTPPSPS